MPPYFFKRYEVWKYQGWESLLKKKSETWIQIQRYGEMMPFLPFGNPWGYRFQGAFGNCIQSTREVDQYYGFLYLWKQILSDFLHQADIKSLNSAKSLNNLWTISSLKYMWVWIESKTAKWWHSWKLNLTTRINNFKILYILTNWYHTKN